MKVKERKVITMSEYDDDLKIDFDQLDINWRDHSANYMKWSEKWVNSVAVRDRKKEALDTLKAELDGKYRKSLLEIDKKKPTEAAVSAAIQSDKTYKIAQHDVINATEDINLLSSAKTAFDHRKKALEGLTSLWIAGYFSDPKIPAEIKEKFKRENPQFTGEQTKVLNANVRLQQRKIKPIKKKK